MSEIEKKRIKIMETILRDAHQSLIATRMTTEQMLPIINQVVKQSAFYPIEVVASSLSRDSGIYGLFALATEEIFQDLCGSGARKNNAGDHFNG